MCKQVNGRCPDRGLKVVGGHAGLFELGWGTECWPKARVGSLGENGWGGGGPRKLTGLDPGTKCVDL